MPRETIRKGRKIMSTICTNPSPHWFVGRWQDWHRGHGCERDDGKPRSQEAELEIEQHARAPGQLTDAALRHMRAATTSGKALLVRALDELAARRAGEIVDCLTFDEIRELRVALTSDTAAIDFVHAIDELAARREGIP
jgi:hypothetical protein